MIRVLIAGVTGWTGVPLAAAVEAADDLELAGGIARSGADHTSVQEALAATDADVLVDYTSAAAVRANVDAALAGGLHVVVGSSGLSAGDFAEIDAAARAAGRGVIAAGNFSVLAATLLHAATLAARHVSHWEVVDYGSAGKPDVPSGTSRELAERLAEVTRPSPPSTTPSDRPARGARRVGRGHARALAAATRLRALDRRRARHARRAARRPSRGRRLRGTRTSPERCSRSAACPRSRACCEGSTGSCSGNERAAVPTCQLSDSMKACPQRVLLEGRSFHASTVPHGRARGCADVRARARRDRQERVAGPAQRLHGRHDRGASSRSSRRRASTSPTARCAARRSARR